MKPCPFCSNLTPVAEEIDVGVWAVVCNTCNTIGPVENFENARQSQERAEELLDHASPAITKRVYQRAPTNVRPLR